MEHLDRKSIDIHVACDDSPGSQALSILREVEGIGLRLTDFGQPVYGRPLRTRIAALAGVARTARSLAGLIAYTRRHRIALVHGTEKPRDVIFGTLVAWAAGARYVVHLHVKAENWIRPWILALMRRSGGLIAVSDFVAESAVALGFRRERIHVVHNALDSTTWDPAATDPGRLRAEFDLEDDELLFVIVARINPWKGHELLLRALAILMRQRVAFRLLVVGEDDPAATPGKSQLALLHTLVDELNLTNRVTFTGYRSDVRDILAACDVFTMPSFEEPFGLVFLEVMAMMKPVVALDSGGTIEIVQHGVTGLLSEPGDAKTFAANVLLLVDDSELRARFGEAARYRVLTEFTPATLASGVT
ncbi:MAG: glycosyltransferase family 4 protein, partial [Polyangiales bacterium]